jgi:hypothetical protein
LESEKEQKIKAYVGSDDGVKVWVNGELVHENKVSRPVEVDNDEFTARLRAGQNSILLKISQLGGPWGFILRYAEVEKENVSAIHRLRYLLSISETFKDFMDSPHADYLPQENNDRRQLSPALPFSLLERLEGFQAYGRKDFVAMLLDHLESFGLLESAREYVADKSAAAPDDLHAALWAMILDTRLGRDAEVQAAWPGLRERLQKEQISYVPVLWLDRALAEREALLDISVQSCEALVAAWKKTDSYDQADLYMLRLADRYLTADKKEQARKTLLDLVHHEWPKSSIDEQNRKKTRRRHINEAVHRLLEAGLHQGAYDSLHYLLDHYVSTEEEAENIRKKMAELKEEYPNLQERPASRRSDKS